MLSVKANFLNDSEALVTESLALYDADWARILFCFDTNVKKYKLCLSLSIFTCPAATFLLIVSIPLLHPASVVYASDTINDCPFEATSLNL